MRTPAIAALAALLITAPALSQQPPQAAQAGEPHRGDNINHPVRGISLELAEEAAHAAIAACKAHDYIVGVTVVDDGGNVRLSLVSDGGPPQGATGSRRTAILSAVQKASGADLAERQKNDPAFAAQVAANHDWLARAGSLLLKSGDKVVGAIGVEGVPHNLDLDVACAQAGIDKIAARIK